VVDVAVAEAAGQAHGGRHVEVDGQVRLEAAGGDLDQLAQHRQVQAVAVALVGQGSVRVAVAQDQLASLERRPDDLSHVLGAGSVHEKGLRQG
jgi:hypothetical protein